MIDIYDVKSFLKDKNIEYEELDDAIKVFHTNRKFNFNYYFVICIRDDLAQILFHSGVSFSNCGHNIYKLLNDLNKTYNFYRIFVEDPKYRDDAYAVYMSTEIQLVDYFTVEDLMDMLGRGMRILEDIYPKLQREVWR